MEVPTVGQLIPEGYPAFRDAIHVAIAPVTSGSLLDILPGDLISIQKGAAYLAENPDNAHGVADPFLTRAIRQGQRFYVFLFPNTVTSLRHVWTHPAFSTTPLSQKETPPE